MRSPAARAASGSRRGRFPSDPDSGPDFLCIGAQKGGTRWLYDQLQLHPDFWMPPVKELHYFDRRSPSAASVNLGRRAQESLKRTNRRQAKLALRPLDQRDIDFLDAYVHMPWWRTDLDAYARLFALKGDLLSGDITPDYSTLDRAPDRADHAPLPEGQGRVHRPRPGRAGLVPPHHAHAARHGRPRPRRRRGDAAHAAALRRGTELPERDRRPLAAACAGGAVRAVPVRRPRRRRRRPPAAGSLVPRRRPGQGKRQ